MSHHPRSECEQCPHRAPQPVALAEQVEQRNRQPGEQPECRGQQPQDNEGTGFGLRPSGPATWLREEEHGPGAEAQDVRRHADPDAQGQAPEIGRLRFLPF